MSAIRDQIAEYGDFAKQLEIVEAQIATLKEQADAIKNSMAEIKDELKAAMMNSGKKTAFIAGWKLNLTTSTATVIEAEDELPEDFWKIERKPDVMRIKDALKQGIEVAGAKLVQNVNLSLKEKEPELETL